MEWTPLVGSGVFDGIRADMVLVVGGIFGLYLIICGISLLVRTIGR